MVYYVCHPLGTGEARVANLARVKRWLAWLTGQYDDAFCCPWVALAEALPDHPSAHERGLRDDLSILRKCDGLVLCGGEISRGMRAELLEYCRTRAPVLTIMDLIELGPEPPPGQNAAH